MTAKAPARAIYVAEPPPAYLGRPPLVVDCSVLVAVLFQEPLRDEALRSMAGKWSDEHIAASLNRMALPTGQGKTWTAHRVASVRMVNDIRAYRSAHKDGEWLTMSEAAAKLGHEDEEELGPEGRVPRALFVAAGVSSSGARGCRSSSVVDGAAALGVVR